MKFKVNTTQIDITPYDDDLSLLEKYSNTIDGTIPSFFRIVARQTTFATVVDIRDAIRGVSLTTLSDPKFIASLTAKYSGLGPKEIVYLWIIVNKVKIEKPDLYELQKIDRYGFITTRKAETDTEEFKKTIEKQRARIKKILDTERDVYKTLDGLESVPSSDFLLDEITSISLV